MHTIYANTLSIHFLTISKIFQFYTLKFSKAFLCLIVYITVTKLANTTDRFQVSTLLLHISHLLPHIQQQLKSTLLEACGGNNIQ